MKTRKERRRPHRTIRRLRVLLAEDDSEMRKLISWALTRRGYEVVECSDGTSLMRKLGLLGPMDGAQLHDLIVSDIRMPGVTGLQVLESAREFSDFPPMILITAFPDTESRAQATRLGAVAMLAKPFDMDDLLGKVQEAVRPEALARKKQHGWLVADQRLPFPLEVTFRHDSGSDAMRGYIEGVAAKLDALSEHILSARLVVDQADREQHKKHRYKLTLVLSTSEKPMVVKYDTDRGAGKDDLYLAVNVVFATALRRLRKSVEKRRQHRTHIRRDENPKEADNVD